MGIDEERQRRMMLKALAHAGSFKKLADAIRMEPKQVARWYHGTAKPNMAAVAKVELYLIENCK
jgi:ribosome-binding protein aMBF1 (putative translation factor)